MTVPGEFGVSAAGAATYTIPILVPPGVAGMTPSLSLNYSSQSGNGILGFGWSLGGLPAITRCARSVAQDGAHGGVNYDGNDRFCLDGQRLLVVSGSYGADGSEYRTEVESFSKIVAHGAAGISGPGWFEVHTKSGQAIELGNTADSRIQPVSAMSGGTLNVARVWAADKISDAAGNYLAITYINDTTNGQYYPDHIVYAGNASAGVAPPVSVYFAYAERNDATTLYRAGAATRTTKLLSDIKTFTNTVGTGTAVTDYRLTYQLGNAPYYQLVRVQRCDGTGTNCLAPNDFGWQTASAWPTRIKIEATQPLPTYNVTINGLTFSGPPGAYLPLDINGDGLQDASAALLTPGCQLTDSIALLATPGPGIAPANMTNQYVDGTTQPACLWGPGVFIPFIGLSGTPIADFDGDGLADITPNNTIQGQPFRPGVMLNDGQGHFVETPSGGAGGVNSLYYNFADLDGDGRTDFAVGSVLNLSQGNGNFQTKVLGSNPPTPVNERLIGDVDGDGCIDLLFQGAENDVRLACNSAVIAVTNPYDAGNIYVGGDFNGDGLADFITEPYFQTGDARLNISTGASFITATRSEFSWGDHHRQLFVGDFDGDGRTDLLAVEETDYKIYTWDPSSNTLTLALTVNALLPQYGCTQCSPSEYNGSIQIADVDGDGCSDLVVEQAAGSFWYTKFGCHPPLLMISIRNGIGSETDIAYGRLNENQPFYTKCPSAPESYQCGDAYPTQAVDGPIYVVKQVDASNGLGVCAPAPGQATPYCFTTAYSYAGAKNDLSGHGFLGFQKVVATNLNSGVAQTTLYSTQFPLTGMVLEQSTALNGHVLSDTTNSYGTRPLVPIMGTPTFVFLTTSHVARSETDGTALPSSTTTNDGYDDYGNVGTVTVAASDGSSKVTHNDYSNDLSRWLLGRLARTTVTSIVGSSTITRVSSFAYDAASGALNEEVVEPSAATCNGDSTSCKLDTVYGLDSFGHRTSAVTSGIGFAARTSATGYDPSGRFVTSTTDALSHVESLDFSGSGGAAFGAPTSRTDANNHTTSWQYDTFGRRTRETLPGANGVMTTASYRYCSGVNGGSEPCPPLGAYALIAAPYAHDGTTQNGPVTRTYYDALSRVIAADIQGFDGASTGCTQASPCWIRVSSEYDEDGHVHRASRPYMAAGGTPQWTTYDYCGDPSGRPCAVAAPDGGTTHYAYTGLGDAGAQVVVNDALGHARTTQTNAQGLASSVTDARGKAMRFVYDAYGDLTYVYDAAGNTIHNTYDLRGNKLTTDDPDVGHWEYKYDALGELVQQTDPNEAASGQHSALSYDGLGRLAQRVEPDQTSTWSYDTAARGVGLLASVSASVSGYGRTHVYDSLSRPTKVTLSVAGTNYVYNRTYNSDGRLDTLTYPSGMVVKYVYTQLGYLQQLKDNVSGAVLWTAKARDADLRLTDQMAGNGVETISYFDPATGHLEQVRASADGHDDGSITNLSYQYDQVGNLVARSDNYGAAQESFCYDALDRVVNYSVGGSSCVTGAYKTVSYDDIGNVTAKSDVGTYAYPGSGTARPHAVSQVAGSVNGILNPKYKYDLDGNLVCVYTGTLCQGSSIARATDTYWASNMTKTITEGTLSAGFTYDADHSRITQILANGSTTTTTTYLNDPVHGAMSEKVAAGGGAATWNDYLMVDGRMVAMRATTAGTSIWSYFLLDHLGSVAVTTDAAARVSARQSFDAWGRRRNQDGSDNTSCAPNGTTITTRGYTGQEELDAFCLVNLNARLYDPTLGRMMSADSVVPDPTDPQSFNRYTYVDNRPLSLTDPTGHADTGLNQNPPHYWNPGSQADATDSNAHPEMDDTYAVVSRSWSSKSAGISGSYTAIVAVNSSGVQGFKTKAGGDANGSVGNSSPERRDAPNDPRNSARTASARNAQNSDAHQPMVYVLASDGKQVATRPLGPGEKVAFADVDLQHSFSGPDAELNALTGLARAIDIAAVQTGRWPEHGGFTVGLDGKVFNTFVRTSDSPDGIFWESKSLDALFSNYDVLDYIHSHPSRPLGWNFSDYADKPNALSWAGKETSFHGMYLDYNGDFYRYPLPNGGSTRKCGSDPTKLAGC